MGLFRRSPKGKWYGRWVDGSGQPRQKAFSHSREIAERSLRQRQEAADLERNGLQKYAQVDLLISDLIERYATELSRSVCPEHLAEVRSALAEIASALSAGTVGELTRNSLLLARQQLMSRKHRRGKNPTRTLSNRTVNKKVGHFVSMLQWAAKNEVIPTVFAFTLDKLPEREKDQSHLRHRYTVDEVRRILAAIEADDRRYFHNGTWSRIPQAPLIRVLIGTGFRFGEATKLRWSDFFKNGGRFWLRVRADNSKTGDARDNPIKIDLANELNELRRTQGHLLKRLPQADDFILLRPLRRPFTRAGHPTALRWLDRILKKAGVPKVDEHNRFADFHGFRHAYCTMLAESGVSLEIASALMGHKDLETTRRIYQDAGRIVVPKELAIDKLPDFEGSGPCDALIGVRPTALPG